METNIGGFIYMYIKDGKAKSLHIPIHLKDDFMYHFGQQGLDLNEAEAKAWLARYNK